MGHLWDLLTNNLISLLIGTLLGTEITRLLYRPQVLIQLRAIKPLVSDNGFFLSVSIANQGRTVASKCAGNVSINYAEADLMDPDQYMLDRFENSLPTYRIENIPLDFPRHQLLTPGKLSEIKNSSLCWSKLGNPSEMNINPGTTQGLDFCRVQLYDNQETNEKFWYLIFPSEQGWRKVRCRIKLTPGKQLTGKLFVCPENVFPTIRKFFVDLDRVDGSPALSLKRYSFLERIYFSFNRTKLYFD